MNRLFRFNAFTAIVVLFLVLPALAFASWTRPLNHDGEQFVAAGALLARYHLQREGKSRLSGSSVPSKITSKAKLLFALKEALASPSNVLLCLAFAFYHTRPLLGARSTKTFPLDSKAILIFITLPAGGSVDATPSYRQYYYSLVPFLIRAIAAQVAHT